MSNITEIHETEATGLLRRLYGEALDRAGRIWNIVRAMSLNPRAMQVAALVVVGGCGDSGAEPPTAPPQPLLPTQVAVRPAGTRLVALDATVQLTPEVRDQNGQIMSGATLAWTSSDPVVARVNASGLVTAVGNGSATITASAGGAAESATMTVEQEVAALTVRPEALAFRALGDTLRLVAAATDANGHLIAVERTIAVEWTSSDATVAHVDTAGLVTAVGNGSATITAAAEGATGTATATVEQEATTLTLSPQTVLFQALGDTLRLMAEAADANGHSVEVEWTSSDAAVARVGVAGLVTAAGNGSATITAAAGAAVRNAVVVVAQAAVALGGLPTADTLLWYGEPADTLRLVATAVDANGHSVEDIPIDIEWSTTLLRVATVDDGGLVRGTGEGVATITATSASLGSASTEVTVVNRDRAALATLYDTTGGPGWRCPGDWSPQRPMHRWCGVITRIRADGVVMVTNLHLRARRLTGSLPPELGNLTNLRSLDLDANSLTGPIPAELGNLANLESLRLSDNNQLTGSIPAELGNLANLRSLNLSDNQLTGPIPAEMGNLANLESLSLRNNELTGPVPPELLGRLTQLGGLDLRDNFLTGPIPAELGNLANLWTLLLGGNLLTGPIPPELGNLVNLGDLLDLSANQLSGPIPRELRNLANLEGSLLLGGNQLTGPIPPELGIFYKLRNLDLSDNQLTGSVPRELGNLGDLYSLELHSNATLSGRLPETLTRLGLNTFMWDDTELCHPPTAAFQQWLQGIGNHRGGPPCGS